MDSGDSGTLSSLSSGSVSLLTSFMVEQGHDTVKRSPEQAGTFHATSVLCTMCTGGSVLVVGSGKGLSETERLRQRKCVLVDANEHRLVVCDVRALVGTHPTSVQYNEDVPCRSLSLCLPFGLGALQSPQLSAD